MINKCWKRRRSTHWQLSVRLEGEGSSTAYRHIDLVTIGCVVAGTNYEFEVEGSSASHNDVTRFVVKVFNQPWTNTTQLTSVVAAPRPQ
ncbi:hypothetical protein PC129_g10417 [Phytophthora cactorum]|uniref:Cystatin domain-containing protein n=1 Tax=Phytophthora cactorum TaxID=29920 RepID=A0A8T1I2W3_9STRA|nr:hypothetical protein PC129_g10417 [Phytophthora cactorum]